MRKVAPSCCGYTERVMVVRPISALMRNSHLGSNFSDSYHCKTSKGTFAKYPRSPDLGLFRTGLEATSRLFFLSVLDAGRRNGFTELGALRDYLETLWAG